MCAGLELGGGVGSVSRGPSTVSAAVGGSAELRDRVGHGERRVVQEEAKLQHGG